MSSQNGMLHLFSPLILAHLIISAVYLYSINRAIVKNPKILVLDEGKSTSFRIDFVPLDITRLKALFGLISPLSYKRP